MYGVMDSNMQIIIPIIYTQINRLIASEKAQMMMTVLRLSRTVFSARSEIFKIPLFARASAYARIILEEKIKKHGAGE
jgi:hypothetical protein